MKVLVGLCAFNEARRIRATLARFPADRAYDICCVDDGSTDDTPRIVDTFPDVTLLRNERNEGAGYSLRRLHHYAVEHAYDIFVSFAAHTKDDPAHIARVVAPIARGEADLVQGSRFLPGGGYRMPWQRVLGARYLHPGIFRLTARRRLTDTSNGFRAYRIALVQDAQLRLEQSWLNRYELEPYLLYQACRLGYRVIEVPVTKHYPRGPGGYSKMRPIIDWWSIARPLVYLRLGMKR